MSKRAEKARDLDEVDGARSPKTTQGEEVRDLMEVGQEVVTGMRLRAICREPQGTIWRAAPVQTIRLRRLWCN